MTPDEIRIFTQLSLDKCTESESKDALYLKLIAVMTQTLGEIAAQLAEINDSLQAFQQPDSKYGAN